MWVCTFHSACVRILRANGDRARLPAHVQHLRPGRRATAGGLRRPRPRPRRQAVPAAGRPRPDQPVEERADHPAAGGRAGGQHLRAQARRHLHRLPGPSAEGRRDGLRRPADEHGRAVPRPPRRARALPAAVPARAHRRVPGHQHGAERDRAALAAGHEQITIVGDHDQSVYRFRGADLRNIAQFEDAFDDVTTIVLDQNYRSTQTILDAANAVIANNPDRKDKQLWSELGHRRRASCATTPRTKATRPRGWRAPCSRCRTTRAFIWKEMAMLLPHQRPEPGGRGSVHALRHPVQGGRRHPLLRPARDQGRHGLPAGRGQPGRRGQREAGAQRAQARASASPAWPSSTRWRPATGIDLRRRHAPRPRGRAHRARGAWCRHRSSGCSTIVRGCGSTSGPGRPAAGGARPTAATWPSSRPRSSVESAGRLENLGELVGSAREFTRLDEFLEQVALVADTDDLDDDNRVVLMTLHSAKGSRVPGGVPHRHGGGCVPAQPGAHRTGRARGGAAPRLRRHHPRPAAAVPRPRLEPAAVRQHQLQPAVAVPRRDPRRARSSRSARSAAAARTAARAIAARDEWSNPPPYRRGDRARQQFDPTTSRLASRAGRRGRDRQHGQRPAQPSPSNCPADRACGSATTSSTRRSAKASSSTSAATTTRPRPPSASATPAPSTSRWRGRP